MAGSRRREAAQMMPGVRAVRGFRSISLRQALDSPEVHTMQKSVSRILFLLLFLLGLGSNIWAQEVGTHILQRVFFIKYGEKCGTSFTIDVQGKQYLITARHLVEGIKEGDSIGLFHENQWKSLKAKPLYLEPAEVDIVVLALPIQISPSYPLELGVAGLCISQTTYFLGFPYGQAVDARTLNNGFPLPFVRQGICSAVLFSPKKYAVLFLDGMGNPGFSGGPIIFFDRDSHKLTVAGVVTRYRNQEDKVLKPSMKKHNKAKSSAKALHDKVC
jgi:S1-C subfamily serine protease